MPNRRNARAAYGLEQRQMFLDFIEQASPEADATSVLLFGQVVKARNQLVQASERELAAVGLTWAKLRLLMNLARQEQCGVTVGAQPSELSVMQDISRNTVSALLSGLEADGLITRELHGRDRRKFVIRLTPSGRRMLKSRLGAHLRFVTHCFDSLGPRERETLQGLLARLNASLEER